QNDQKWNLEHIGDGNYKIINNRSSKCLNVSDNSTANGANVWQWDWLNKGDQKWKLVPVECDTSANHWDTDADGLSDMFEVYSAVDYGTNPRIADTDDDGLTDMLEFELGTLPDEKDTDDDGLTDFEEHRGWRINFTYRGSGPVFDECVWSNPLVNDSDMDGLNDSEEYRIGFNPRSSDTNGDGINDYDEVHGKSAGASAKEGSSTSTRGTDNDGLTDEIETAGWNITLTNSTGTYTIHVTSEHLLQDTDFDGLSDSEEYNLGSNPRALDTDGDGLNDFVERELGTNITHYDTDGDGLDDGTEVTFGSDPKQNDTDADGLPDFEEFELGSDPINNDTDSDGLTDLQEKQFNTSLRNPDSDADLLFDNEEYNLSTDPWNPDTDSDNLTDGYESVYNTNATNNDTDADGILDGDEIDLWTNPLSNDTDSDGLLDLRELELGTNPVNADTNGDGIKDSEDPDTHVPQVERVILAHDRDGDTYEFVDKLKQYTNVTVVTAEELLLNYSDAQYIVLVGRPDGNGTVGNVTRDILNVSGDVTTQMEMLESDCDRVAVEYGVWTPTQTVVMLSQPYKYDYCRVLSILKSMRVTRLPDSVEVVYPSARDFFSVEMVKEVDSSVWVDLEHAVTPWVKMSRYNASTTPFSLSHAAGLAEDEEAVGRYFGINVSKNVQNETGDIINWTWVGMYYTASDLDRNGDGDANDTGDIPESTLRLYYSDESANRWIKLSADLDWVFDTGLDTTEDEQYGKEYEGFVWANVSHLCLFGLAGKTATPIITSFAPPSPVKDILNNWRSFNVTVNQKVNVSWYLNESLLFTDENVTEANYWLHAIVVGEHNVSAIATNANGTDIQTWVWNVETPSPCYIATATYGTPLDSNINVLRDFRDDVLMTNPLGEAFVSTYYATSPPIADALRENDGLRAATRLSLITPLVYFSGIMLNGFWFVLLMLLLGLAAAVLLLREDKKKLLKSLLVGAGTVLVFITAIFSLGFVGYRIPFCAVIGAYLLPFVIPLSVVFTLCTHYKSSWFHKQTTRFHKIYTRLKIRE
ncbi:hypothetical protein C4E24_07445, partial [ANME-1 cluster archaeon AG-394-G21]|nr:hypothetical protein [ANME-1 cluster archaeon AG-394-G21]